MSFGGLKFALRSFCSRTYAFTLVELLVVIAIVGLLASLLMPVLSKSKNKGSQVIDINNLKQIVTSVQMYASENGETLPWPNWGPAKRPGWLYTLDTTFKGPSRFRIAGGVLWGDLKTGKVYLCPLDNTNSALFSRRQQQLSSYAMNGAVVGYDRTNYPPAKMTSMHPDDVLFWETDETQPQYFNDGANFPSEGVSARHSKGAINASLGGSVSYSRLGAWYVMVYQTNKNQLWCYPGSANGR
jgi:prepilin-type N-terminal cleavage/methylation domain-containing protein